MEAAGDSTGAHVLRVGTAPVNWNNFDLDGWRPEVPYPGILDEMKRAGYDCHRMGCSFRH